MRLNEIAFSYLSDSFLVLLLSNISRGFIVLFVLLLTKGKNGQALAHIGPIAA